MTVSEIVQLPCAVHAGEIEIDTERDGPPGCPECGKLLSFASCWFCNTDWLVFGTGSDDVIADTAVTLSGDVMCWDCALRTEAEEMDEENEMDDYTQ